MNNDDFFLPFNFILTRPPGGSAHEWHVDTATTDPAVMKAAFVRLVTESNFQGEIVISTSKRFSTLTVTSQQVGALH